MMPCPKCQSSRLVPVGQYSKLVKRGFLGAGVLIIAAVIVPIFWLVLPIWMLGSIWMYLTRPLLACEDCDHMWDPRNPKAVIQRQKAADS
ncbi:MAG: hypothetical protein IBX71_01480 [Candidatus Desulforudis sp.]|nr:hypothetical protein [Desulforudis sp.]